MSTPLAPSQSDGDEERFGAWASGEMSQSHRTEKQLVPCQHCDQKLADKATMERHCREFHPNELTINSRKHGREELQMEDGTKRARTTQSVSDMANRYAVSKAVEALQANLELVETEITKAPDISVRSRDPVLVRSALRTDESRSAMLDLIDSAYSYASKLKGWAERVSHPKKTAKGITSDPTTSHAEQFKAAFIGNDAARERIESILKEDIPELVRLSIQSGDGLVMKLVDDLRAEIDPVLLNKSGDISREHVTVKARVQAYRQWKAEKTRRENNIAPIPTNIAPIPTNNIAPIPTSTYIPPTPRPTSTTPATTSTATRASRSARTKAGNLARRSRGVSHTVKCYSCGAGTGRRPREERSLCTKCHQKKKSKAATADDAPNTTGKD